MSDHRSVTFTPPEDGRARGCGGHPGHRRPCPRFCSFAAPRPAAKGQRFGARGGARGRGSTPTRRGQFPVVARQTPYGALFEPAPDHGAASFGMVRFEPGGVRVRVHERAGVRRTSRTWCSGISKRSCWRRRGCGRRRCQWRQRAGWGQAAHNRHTSEPTRAASCHFKLLKTLLGASGLESQPSCDSAKGHRSLGRLQAERAAWVDPRSLPSRLWYCRLSPPRICLAQPDPGSESTW